MDPAAVLTALAELAPSGRGRVLDATGGRAPLWLTDPDRPPRRKATQRLAAMDALHRDERLLRRGWVFVIGRAQFEGAWRRVCLPLLHEPVRLRQGLRGYAVVPAGDLALTDLVEDEQLAAELEGAEGVGTWAWLRDDSRLSDWIRATCAAAGLAITQVRPSSAAPPRADHDDGLVAVARAGLYLGREVFSGRPRDSLRSWVTREGLDRTALAAVYGDADVPEGAGTTDRAAEAPVLSPLPLSAAQTEVVRRCRTEPVVVVSGPPGSGKSHTVVATALDVVGRGGSVLLATQSTHAADVLGELLRRYPGPTPVLFGDTERRNAIEADLAAGAGTLHGGTAQGDRVQLAQAKARVDRLAAALTAALELEHRAAGLEDWQPLLPGLMVDVPGAFRDQEVPAAVDRLVRRVHAPATGAVSRLLRRWGRRRLYARLRAAASVPLDRIMAAIDAAGSVHAASRLASAGGTDLAATWRAWFEAQSALADAVGTAVRYRAASAARGRAAQRSLAALASALRAGRHRRRQLLATMDGPALVRALPLWVGTAADVAELLPPVPGLFDLVILDEASHLDQVRAAEVLVRGRRALVVGDPRQLRFVSFVADVDVAATLHRHGLDERVDVRRVSAYDLATSAARVTWLDEHYRSVPHLIQFSAERFYPGRVSVLTRHPANEALDVIDVVRVVDGSLSGGVNRGEVGAAVEAVRRLAASGLTSIGVITPFRSQAEALEQALLDAFPVEDVERLGLRVGTVHAFQGSEADAVVVSLAVTDDDPPARVRFVSDPHLFNVMMTRARRRMVVITSLTRPAGLVASYLRYAETGPRPPDSSVPADAWTRALADGLRRAGVPVRCDYPVGRWNVDLCVGEGADATGVICRVHPDGAAAHLARQRALTAAGWRLVDAFPSRWSGDPAAAVVQLSAGALATTTGPDAGPPHSSTATPERAA